MARFAAPEPIWARIIDEPASNKAYAQVKVSSQAGIAQLRALKRHREAFRSIRSLLWGDTLSEPPAPPVTAIADTAKEA
jgi:ribosomal protein RSM22 (predicted rRNA methylase)